MLRCGCRGLHIEVPALYTLLARAVGRFPDALRTPLRIHGGGDTHTKYDYADTDKFNSIQ